MRLVRSRTAALAALLCATASLGLGACGGDAESTTQPQAVTATTTTEPSSTVSTAEPTTTTGEGNGGVEAGANGGGEPSGNQSNGNVSGGGQSAGSEGSGGSQVPDTPSHDVVPPANTPQGKFEQFCNQNPGACG